MLWQKGQVFGRTSRSWQHYAAAIMTSRDCNAGATTFFHFFDFLGLCFFEFKGNTLELSDEIPEGPVRLHIQQPSSSTLHVKYLKQTLTLTVYSGS